MSLSKITLQNLKRLTLRRNLVQNETPARLNQVKKSLRRIQRKTNSIVPKIVTPQENGTNTVSFVKMEVTLFVATGAPT